MWRASNSKRAAVRCNRNRGQFATKAVADAPTIAAIPLAKLPNRCIPATRQASGFAATVEKVLQ